jgi:hypothetical protein
VGEGVEMRGHGWRSSPDQDCTKFSFVMPALVAGIHVFTAAAH